MNSLVYSKPLGLLGMLTVSENMSIVIKLENLDCGKICKEIEKYLSIKKPDPNKNYLVIGLSEMIDSGDNHIKKLEHKE